MNPIIKYKKFSIFFLFIMVINYFGLTVIPEFYMVTKALIMGSLIGFYIYEMEKQSESFLLGLIASLLGDIFLLFSGESFFLIGMLSFFIMQSFYITRFLKDRDNESVIKPLFPAVLFILGIGFIYMIWDLLGNMAIYISLYTLAIIAMAIVAYMRRASIQGYRIVVGGSLLFIVSDISLALDRFYMDYPYSNFIIMTTYMIAQYLIVTGIVLQKEKRVEKKGSKSKLTHSTLSKL